MKLSSRPRVALVGIFAGLLGLSNSTSTGAVTATGDVNPADPTTWTSSTNGYIGYSAAGSVTVNGGSVESISYTLVGFDISANGTLNVDGAGSAWTSTTTSVGYLGAGTLNVTHGATVSSALIAIGDRSGSNGTVILDGAGSACRNCADLYVANSGNGTLQITNGAVVSSSSACITYIGCNAGSAGLATIDGAGSTWTGAGNFYVGDLGNGTLNVTNGATLSNADAYIGAVSGSTGTATVDGAGSTWTSSSTLAVGTAGTGTLNITNGAVVTVSGDTTVGSGASSGVINFGAGTLNTAGLVTDLGALTGTGTINARGLVTDVDLAFDASHPLKQTLLINNLPGQNITINLDVSTYAGALGAGYEGSGSLRIADGVVINSGEAYLGYLSGSAGVATVDGAGSQWLTGDLDVGVAGNGTLNITNGAAVTAFGNVTTGSAGGSGAINFNNGTLTATGGLLANISALTGIGTITASGLVSDLSLVFDSTHGAHQTFLLNSLPGQNITLNVTFASGSVLGAGFAGNGSLRIADGVQINSAIGYIGYQAGSTGVATIDGAGSAWTVSQTMYVGWSGSGTLNFTNGAGSCDLNATACIGAQPGSTGIVNVDGAGSQWTLGGLWVGEGGSGVLNVTHGGTVYSAGYASSAIGTGVATVDGAGSQWTPGELHVGAAGNGTLNVSNGGTLIASSQGLYVGYSGFGTVNINSGGMIKNCGDIYIGSIPYSTGVVNVDGPGPTLTCGYLLVGGRAITGNIGRLSITRGATVVSSAGDISTDAGYQALATVDGAGSMWTITGSLSVGLATYGTLNILHGGAVSCSSASLEGFGVGPAAATINADGAGSAFTITGSFSIGNGGPGALNVTNGAQVSDATATINGSYNSAIASANVNGAGSTWTHSGALSVGRAGSQGILKITNGAAVSAASVSVNSGLLMMDIGRSSQLTVGNGTGEFDNYSNVWLGAGPSVAPGVYTPIAAAIWGDYGCYEAFGGLWNPVAHNVTVTGAQAGSSGQPVTIDPSVTQRILVTDPASGATVGVALPGTTYSSSLTVTATAITGAALSPLANTFGGGSAVPAAWQFIGPMGTAYVSMDIGSGYSGDSMQVWRFNGTNWAPYTGFPTTPLSFNYDAMYANFMVSGPNGYALVAFDHPILNTGTLYVIADADLGALPAAPAVNLTFTGTSTLCAAADGVTLNANRGLAVASGVTATFDTQAYSLTVAGAVSGPGTLKKIGSGTLYLTGANTCAGTTVIAGTLKTSQFNASVVVSEGAAAILTRSGGTNPHASIINGAINLSGTGGGIVDLTDNGVIITSASAPDVGIIQALIAAEQLTSSVVTAANAARPGSMTIAYDFASNIGLTFTNGFANWGGQTISQASASSDLLILPTLVGDLNLDGAVNFTDITALAPNLGKQFGNTWGSGDLSGDGAVNFTDVTMLAPNLGMTVAGLEAATPGLAMVSNPSAANAAVPEPASLVLMSLGGLAILRRRQRYHAEM